jgi:predicted nucleotide-binding protein (sugar kinase/HSP70/actin superfamily)
MHTRRSANRPPHNEPDFQSIGRLEGDEAGAFVDQQVEEARRRLRRRAGADRAPAHFVRPEERPFTAEDRGRVTILFGGLTPAHETLIQAVFQASGHRAEPLPQPDIDACLVGRQYCNNGVCNPAYFTVGNLVKYLQGLEASGLSRREIVDGYVFFTAGGCGPCRFGMYEEEYRLALRNAGFEGFRVLLFQQTDGIKARTGGRGFELSLHLGLNTVNAFTLADAIRDFGYRTRPFEEVAGSVNAAIEPALATAARLIRDRTPVTAGDRLPPALARAVERRPALKKWVPIALNVHDHLWGRYTGGMSRAAAEAMAGLEVDRLRVKPVVKVIGEFWAQTTESAGNFNMMAFLEREGAEVLAESLSTWVLFLLNHARANMLYGAGIDVPMSGPLLPRWRARARSKVATLQKRAYFSLGRRLYLGVYDRARAAFGGVPHPLVNPAAFAEVARPFYHELARGGESYLEVGKHIYYTRRNGAHMVLSLKPFGCMPSMQSDGVQSLVMARFKDTLYLPIETAPDGELDAHSRVQMVLVEARARAQAEFARELEATGKRLEDIRAYVADHPEMRRATYHVPHRDGIAGTAANFVRHVSDRMDRDRRRAWRRA